MQSFSVSYFTNHY